MSGPRNEQYVRLNYFLVCMLVRVADRNGAVLSSGLLPLFHRQQRRSDGAGALDRPAYGHEANGLRGMSSTAVCHDLGSEDAR